MKKFMFFLILVLNFSCNEVDLKDENINVADVKSSFDDLQFSNSDKLREKFGRALGKALLENQELRAFLKKEALIKFNNDFDVMYHLVKNKSISKGEQKGSTESYITLRTILLNYFESENDLIQIENQLPLLTIFIPTLPENSFSAANWDVTDLNQVPAIAIRMDNHNEVPIIDVKDNIEFVAKATDTPGFPVIVIKNNERVVLNNGNDNYLNSSQLLTAGSLVYKFVDDNFNGALTPNDGISDTEGTIIEPNPTQSPCTFDIPHVPSRSTTVPQFIKNAYNVFEPLGTNVWQRDNVYYQLTPTQTTNFFTNGRYKEHITYFRMNGNSPEEARISWNRIANSTIGQHTDPTLINSWSTSTTSAWTEGDFEFIVSVNDGSKVRNTTNTQAGFGASPVDLFSYTHAQIQVVYGEFPFRRVRMFYNPIINGLKGYDMTNTQVGFQRCQVHQWDLSIYKNIWNIEIKEMDTDVTYTSQDFAGRKYNSNIQVTGSIPNGVKEKIGLQFGATAEETINQTRTFTFKTSPDWLGQMDIAFGDNIVNKNPCNNVLYPNIYQFAHCTIEFRPLQVQN